MIWLKFEDSSLVAKLKISKIWGDLVGLLNPRGWPPEPTKRKLGQMP